MARFDDQPAVGIRVHYGRKYTLFDGGITDAAGNCASRTRMSIKDSLRSISLQRSRT